MEISAGLELFFITVF